MKRMEARPDIMAGMANPRYMAAFAELTADPKGAAEKYKVRPLACCHHKRTTNYTHHTHTRASRTHTSAERRGRAHLPARRVGRDG